MKSEPMDVCPTPTMDSGFVSECEELGRVSDLTVDVIRSLIILWDKLQKGNEAGDFGDVDKCLESLLICTAHLLLNPHYLKPKKVPPNCRSDLKTAIHQCGLKFSDSAKRKNICLGLTDVVCQPWTTPEFLKVHGGLKPDTSNLNVSPTDVDGLWNSEGWIFLESRVDRFLQFKSKSGDQHAALGHVCTFLNILVKKGQEFYESNNLTTKPSVFYDPFKFPYSKYLEYLEVYTIMASQGFIDAQNIISCSDKTILDVMNGLNKKAEDPNSVRTFQKLIFWKGAADAALFLAKAATWNALKSDESEMVHEYFTEWLRLNESDSEEESSKFSPLNEIIEKFDEVKTPANVYIIANAAVEYHGKIAPLTPIYLTIFIQAMYKEMNLILDAKSQNNNQDKGHVRKLERKFSRPYVQLARFFKHNLQKSKECLLTAFSLNPCVKLFKCLFPKSEFANDCKDEDDDDDFLSSELKDIRDVQYDMETSDDDDLQLSTAILEDLESVIHNLRYKGLFRWNTQVDTERLCYKLLQNESLDVIDNQKLEYVNVDYEKYKDFPSRYDPDDDGIEKGYREEDRLRKRMNNTNARLLKGLLKKPAKFQSFNGSGKVSKRKLNGALGTVRRGRPLKHKTERDVLKNGYKTISKFKSVRIGNEFKCNDKEVREIPNYVLPTSPWFPRASEDNRLTYGELFIKLVRPYSHDFKERILGRHFGVENQLISSVTKTVYSPPPIFHGDGVPMETCQLSEKLQNPPLGKNIEQFGSSKEDPRLSTVAGYSSPNYSNDQLPSTSASTIQVLSPSQFLHQLPQASVDYQIGHLQELIVKMNQKNQVRKQVSQKDQKGFKNLLKACPVDRFVNKVKMSEMPSNSKGRRMPTSKRKLRESKTERVVKPRRSSAHNRCQTQSPIFQETVDFKLSQSGNVVNEIASNPAGSKFDLGELGNVLQDNKPVSEDSGFETLMQPPVPAESLLQNPVLMPVPEVLPDCAFQIMGRYRKGEEPSKFMPFKATPSRTLDSATGKALFHNQSMISAHKREDVHAAVGPGVLSFQTEATSRSPAIRPPEERRPQSIVIKSIKKTYSGSKAKKLIVIKSAPPMDAYTTVSKPKAAPVPSNGPQKDVPSCTGERIEEMECTATGEPRVLHDHIDTDINKCSDSKNSVTVDLKMFKNNMLIALSSRIANKEIKVGSPDYAKQTTSSVEGHKTDEVPAETTQIRDDSGFNSEPDALRLQSLVEPEPTLNKLPVTVINSELVDNEIPHQLIQHNQASNDNSQYISSQSAIASNNVDSNTEMPEQETLIVSSVSEVPQMCEPSDDSQAHDSNSLDSDVEILEVAVEENKHEEIVIKECIKQMLDLVDKNEKMSADCVDSEVNSSFPGFSTLLQNPDSSKDTDNKLVLVPVLEVLPDCAFQIMDSYRKGEEPSKFPTMAEREEQNIGENQSGDTCDNVWEEELNCDSDASTIVDDPQIPTFKNQRTIPRSVTPVEEAEALCERIQQKLRKNKRPYEDEDDKIKFAASVVAYCEQNNKSLRSMLSCVPRVEKLSNDQIPARFRSQFPVKRSTRLKRKKMRTVEAIQTEFQTNAPKGGESSRRESRESSPEIQFIEEIIKNPSSANTNNEIKEGKILQPIAKNSTKDLFLSFKNQNGKSKITKQNLESADHQVKSEVQDAEKNVKHHDNMDLKEFVYDIRQENEFNEEVVDDIRQENELKEEVVDDIHQENELKEEVVDDIRQENELKKEVVDDIRQENELKKEVVDDIHQENELKEEVVNDIHQKNELLEEGVDDIHQKNELLEGVVDDIHQKNELLEGVVDDIHLQNELKEEVVDDIHLQNELKEEVVDDIHLQNELKEEVVDDIHPENELKEGVVDDIHQESERKEEVVDDIHPENELKEGVVDDTHQENEFMEGVVDVHQEIEFLAEVGEHRGIEFLEQAVVIHQANEFMEDAVYDIHQVNEIMVDAVYDIHQVNEIMVDAVDDIHQVNEIMEDAVYDIDQENEIMEDAVYDIDQENEITEDAVEHTHQENEFMENAVDIHRENELLYEVITSHSENLDQASVMQDDDDVFGVALAVQDDDDDEEVALAIRDNNEDYEENVSMQIQDGDSITQEEDLQILEIQRPITPSNMSINDSSQTISPVIPVLLPINPINPMDSDDEMHSDSNEEPPVLICVHEEFKKERQDLRI